MKNQLLFKPDGLSGLYFVELLEDGRRLGWEKVVVE